MDTTERIEKMLKKTEVFFNPHDLEQRKRMIKELREYENYLESRIKHEESCKKEVQKNNE